MAGLIEGAVEIKLGPVEVAEREVRAAINLAKSSLVARNLAVRNLAARGMAVRNGAIAFKETIAPATAALSEPGAMAQAPS